MLDQNCKKSARLTALEIRKFVLQPKPRGDVRKAFWQSEAIESHGTGEPACLNVPMEPIP
jgi:hypothetical protein